LFDDVGPELIDAASGDLRNVIVTVTSLPETYPSPINIVVNDRDMHVTLRNLLLLLTFAAFSPAQSAEMGLHLWYSAKMPPAIMDSLRHYFSSQLQKIETHMAKTPGTLGTVPVSTTFKLGEKSKVHVMMPRFYWSELFSILTLRMAGQDATKSRNIIAVNPDRLDNRERYLYIIPPDARVPKQRFFTEGLLLPFGADRSEFTDTNMSIFLWYIARNGS